MKYVFDIMYGIAAYFIFLILLEIEVDYLTFAWSYITGAAFAVFAIRRARTQSWD